MKDKYIKQGFTLIELLAVIVILAILALIAIPIVINIINDSRENSNKRSIEAYGKSVENAIANYQSKIDSENLPDDINAYDVKMNGNKVICDKRIIFTDESIKLTNCYVADNKGNQKSKKKYTYANRRVVEGDYTSYAQGDLIYVNNIPFLVLKNSDESEDYVVAIKSIPLTYDELEKYGSGIMNRYKNNGHPYTDWNYDKYQTGYVAYYSNYDCGYHSEWSYNDNGCTNIYAKSDVKRIVDNWASNEFSDETLSKIDGYKARLITYEELTHDLHYSYENSNSPYFPANAAPEDYHWIYGEFTYWTMSPYYDYNNAVWYISHDHLVNGSINSAGQIAAVRPVINVYKSAIDNRS